MLLLLCCSSLYTLTCATPIKLSRVTIFASCSSLHPSVPLGRTGSTMYLFFFFWNFKKKSVNFYTTYTCTAATAHPDGHKIALGSNDNTLTVRLWGMVRHHHHLHYHLSFSSLISPFSVENSTGGWDGSGLSVLVKLSWAFKLSLFNDTHQHTFPASFFCFSSLKFSHFYRWFG